MWGNRDAAGAYAGSYTGQGYNELEEISPGHQYQVAAARAAAPSATAPVSILNGLPTFGLGNLGLGLIGLTAALLVIKRVL